jgi:2-phospho-L-lactate/phosphoenolpyruvate guanylyltransferase
MGTSSPLTWSVVIPVKVLARAKTRLSGLTDADRRALALAMAADTVAAAVACPPVGTVVVVSDDPEVTRQARAIGAEVTPDRPSAGLNEALVAGAEFASRRWPGRGVAALTADLPALTSRELEAALSAASAATHAFVADAVGSGTTFYAASPGAPFRPRFGPRSRQRHRQAGAAEIDLPGLAGLRRDVDTLADLRDAAQIGLGRRSAAIEAVLAVR